MVMECMERKAEGNCLAKKGTSWRQRGARFQSTLDNSQWFSLISREWKLPSWDLFGWHWLVWPMEIVSGKRLIPWWK